MPIVFYFTGLHPDYHRPTDTVDKIIFDKIQRIAQLAYETGRRVANSDKAPVKDNLGPRAGKGHKGSSPAGDGRRLNDMEKGKGKMEKLLARGVAAVAACVIAAVVMPAQEREDRTFLSHDQMRSIINEASGERAMHTLLELVPYQRVRPASEYKGAFRESEVMARLAKEYGNTNVRIETFPSGPQWQPSVGELWIRHR